MAKIADENNPKLDGFRWTQADLDKLNSQVQDVLYPKEGETPRHHAHRQVNEELEMAIDKNNRALNNPDAANTAAREEARTKHKEIDSSHPHGKKGDEWFDKPYHDPDLAQPSGGRGHADGRQGPVDSSRPSSADIDRVRNVEAQLRAVGLDPGHKRDGREDGVIGSKVNAGIEKVIVWAQIKSGGEISGDYTAETSKALHSLNPRLADALDKLRDSGQLAQHYGPQDVGKVATEIERNRPDFSMSAGPSATVQRAGIERTGQGQTAPPPKP